MMDLATFWRGLRLSQLTGAAQRAAGQSQDMLGPSSPMNPPLVQLRGRDVLGCSENRNTPCWRRRVRPAPLRSRRAFAPRGRPQKTHRLTAAAASRQPRCHGTFPASFDNLIFGLVCKSACFSTDLVSDPSCGGCQSPDGSSAHRSGRAEKLEQKIEFPPFRTGREASGGERSSPRSVENQPVPAASPSLGGLEAAPWSVPWSSRAAPQLGDTTSFCLGALDP